MEDTLSTARAADRTERQRSGPRLAAGLAALLPVVVLLGAWIAPLALGTRTLYLRDVLNTHLPMKAAHAALLRAGQWLPLVDPQRAGGQPLLGNPNAVPLYPDNVLYRVAPTLWALNAHLWLHLLGALVGMYFLGRAFGLARSASVAAGVVYAFSGYALSNLNFYNLIAGVALAPGFVAAIVACRRRGGTSAAALAGILWSLLLLGGEPLLAALALVLGGLAWIYSVGAAPRRAGLALPVAALALGTLVAAPQLVELARILPASLRGFRGYGADAGTVGRLDPRQVLDWLLPFATGRPDLLQSGALWGDAFYAGKPPIFFSLFAGAFAWALLLVSGIDLKRSSDPSGASWIPLRRWAWTSIALGVALALGSSNPLVRPLFGLGLVRYPVKCLLLAVPPLALLAGLGWQRAFLGARRRALGRWLAGFAALVAVAWLGLTLAPRAGEALLRGLVPPRFEDAFVAGERLRWAGTLFLMLAVLLLLLVVERATRAKHRAWAAGLLLGAHACGQFLLLRPLIATDAVEAYRTPSPALAAIPPGTRVAHGEVSNLFGPPALGAASLERAELRFVERRAFAWLYPSAGVPAGIRYELDTAADGLDAYVTRVAEATVERLPDAARVWLLRSWATEHLLLGRPLAPDAAALVEPPRLLEVEGGPLYDYAFADAVPAVRFAGNVVPAADINVALAVLLRPDFDPRTTVALAGVGPTEPGGRGTVIVGADEAERVEVEVTAESAGAVVFERAPLPIYRASVDGAPAAVEIANVQRAAVRVPAGRHRVVLATDRRPTRAAAVAACVALLGLAGMGLAGRRRSGGTAGTG